MIFLKYSGGNSFFNLFSWEQVEKQEKKDLPIQQVCDLESFLLLQGVQVINGPACRTVGAFLAGIVIHGGNGGAVR